MAWNRVSFFATLSLMLILAACGNEDTAGVSNEASSYSANPEVNNPSIYWAGSFSGPEEIPDPEYLWVYYNTTDGCSYIYTQLGWTLFASGANNINNQSSTMTINGRDGINGQKGSDGRDGIDGRDGSDGRDGVDGRDGIDGKDGRDGADGRDGIDGKDGKDGVDGRDGIDGKDGKDGVDGRDGADGKDGKDGFNGRDGIDGKDGEDGFVFIGENDELDDGVTYDVKSYAQLEAGNPYFYTYYKFYLVNNKLAKTYVCYNTVANGASKQISYLDFNENDCAGTSYIKTYSRTGYVIRSTFNNATTKQIYIYYPSSSITHYWAVYNGNSFSSATAYDRNGNVSTTTTSVSTYLSWIANVASMDDFSADSDNPDSSSLFSVESITLDRYHILGTSTNRKILAMVVVNDISLVDTSEGLFIQVTNQNQDTVINFRATAISQDTIMATISAPILDRYSYAGKEYTVRLKIGEQVFKNTSTKFNVSDSYYNITINSPSRINLDKARTDSFSVTVKGYNMDFVNKVQIITLDGNQIQQGDSVAVDLTPIQWLSDTCKNLQTVSAKIPNPSKEGKYDLVLIVNGEKYGTTKYSFFVHKNPYFTSFVIPDASIDNADSYVNATLTGKNFEKAGLDISALNLVFSKDYEVVDTLKYEATLRNDSMIMLKIYIPKDEGSYKISAYYDEASILSTFNVSEKCSANLDGKIVQKDGTFFVCEVDTFRIASEQEININKGCTNKNEGMSLYKNISSTTKWNYECLDGIWNVTPIFKYGILIDSRDLQSYKTIVIGEQTWMAENLNYADSINYPSMLSRNWCYNNSLDSCDKYGRLYTWAAAIDSVKLYDDGNGLDCGYGKNCELPVRIQGICPNGWHLPDSSEWNALFNAVGGKSNAGEFLKSTTWHSGADAYGFSALPAGYRYYSSFKDKGSYAYFWSASDNNSSVYADYIYLYSGSTYAFKKSESKQFGYSVRCVMD